MNNRKILVMGAGNPMRRDDGIGPFIIEQLRMDSLPANVFLKDAGIDSLSMIDAMSEFDQVLVIDAVDMKQKPGDIRIFTPAEVKTAVGSDSFSTHGFGLADLFELMQLLGYRVRIRVIGIQPEDIGYGHEFSEALGARMSELIEMVRNTVAAFNLTYPVIDRNLT